MCDEDPLKGDWYYCPKCHEEYYLEDDEEDEHWLVCEAEEDES